MNRLSIIVPWSTARDLKVALAGLVAMNVAMMRMHPVPKLYSGRVRYKREARTVSGARKEHWLTAHEVNRRGGGDCEDLATYRAAELRLRGENARAVARPSAVGWHIVVQRGDGSIEDPSKALGM